MLKNTLRQQFSWHNRQQAQSFKKIQRENCKQPLSNTCEKEEKNQNQLQWLEKMVNELQSYNGGLFKDKDDYITIHQDNKQNKEPQVLGESKVKIKNNEAVLTGKDVKIKTNQTKVANQKKVKFQVITKENSCPLSAKKKTTSNRKGLINETISQISIKKPSVPTPKSCTKKPLGQTINKKKISSVPSSVIADVQQIKTDPYSLLQTSSFAINKDNLTKQKQPSKKLRDMLLYGGRKGSMNRKKSVGKIVRNIDRLNQTYFSVKQSQKPASSIMTGQKSQQKCQPEKIFIKLQTEKLQQYLVQSVVKPQSSQILKTEECQKYCQSNQTQPFKMEIGGNHLQRQLLDQSSASLNQNETTSVPRSKSQQRRFNKCVEMIKPKRLFEPYIKGNQIATQIGKEALTAFSSKISNTTTIPEVKSQMKPIQPKLKRVYEYKEQIQIPFKNPILDCDTSMNQKKVLKAQKLFTLQSMGNEAQQIKLEQQRKSKPIEHKMQIYQNTNISHDSSLQKNHYNAPYSKRVELSNGAKQQRLKQISPEIINIIPPREQMYKPLSQFYSQSFSELPGKEGHSQQLVLLFNFLDESKRGFLADSNCSIDKLTEQLKMLFSFILNQIKTKKKFYTLQSFVGQSEQVLQIKTQVYTNHNGRSQRQIYDILKSNIDILKRRYPLQFLKHTQTQSIYQPNIESKRNSINSNVSIVIQQLRMNSYQKGRSPLHKIQNTGCDKFQSYKDRGIIDEQEPEVFLQKKYGLRKCQGQQYRLNTNQTFASRKTRTYLQNLDQNRNK